MCNMYNSAVQVDLSNNGFYTLEFQTHLCLQFLVLPRRSNTFVDKQEWKDRLALLGYSFGMFILWLH